MSKLQKEVNLPDILNHSPEKFLQLQIKLLLAYYNSNKKDQLLEPFTSLQIYNELYLKVFKDKDSRAKRADYVGKEYKDTSLFDSWRSELLKGITYINSHLPQGYDLRDVNFGAFQAVLNELKTDPTDSALAPGGQGGLIEIATGGGKTGIAAALIAALPKGKKAVIVCHSQVLAKQIAREITPFLPGKKITFDFSGTQKDTDFNKDYQKSYDGDVIVTVVRSFAKNTVENLSEALVIADECHKYQNASDFRSAMTKLGPKSILIKFSATPIPYTIEEKANYVPVICGKTLFYVNPAKMPHEKLLYSYSMSQAIESKALAPLRWKSLTINSLSAEVIQSLSSKPSKSVDEDDYSDSKISELFRENESVKQDLVDTFINFYKENEAYHRSTLTMVSCQDISFAEYAAKRVHEKTRVGTKPGVNTVVISSEQCLIYSNNNVEKVDRTKALEFFENNVGTIAFQIDTLTEGYSNNQVSCLWMMRPTKSVTRYKQFVGRGTRKDPNNPSKELLIVDISPGDRHAFEPLRAPLAFGLPEPVEGELLIGPGRQKPRDKEPDAEGELERYTRLSKDAFFSKFKTAWDVKSKVRDECEWLEITLDQINSRLNVLAEKEFQKNNDPIDLYKFPITSESSQYKFNPVVAYLVQEEIKREYEIEVEEFNNKMKNSILISDLSDELNITKYQLNDIIRFLFTEVKLGDLKDCDDLNYLPKSKIPIVVSEISKLKSSYNEDRTYYGIVHEIEKMGIPRVLIRESLDSIEMSGELSLVNGDKIKIDRRENNSLDSSGNLDNTYSEEITNIIKQQIIQKNKDYLNCMKVYSDDQKFGGLSFDELKRVWRKADLKYKQIDYGGELFIPKDQIDIYIKAVTSFERVGENDQRFGTLGFTALKNIWRDAELDFVQVTNKADVFIPKDQVEHYIKTAQSYQPEGVVSSKQLTKLHSIKANLVKKFINQPGTKIRKYYFLDQNEIDFGFPSEDIAKLKSMDAGQTKFIPEGDIRKKWGITSDEFQTYLGELKGAGKYNFIQVDTIYQGTKKVATYSPSILDIMEDDAIDILPYKNIRKLLEEYVSKTITSIANPQTLLIPDSIKKERIQTNLAVLVQENSPKDGEIILNNTTVPVGFINYIIKTKKIAEVSRINKQGDFYVECKVICKVDFDIIKTEYEQIKASLNNYINVEDESFSDKEQARIDSRSGNYSIKFSNLYAQYCEGNSLNNNSILSIDPNKKNIIGKNLFIPKSEVANFKNFIRQN